MEEASNRDLEHVDMDQVVQEINKRKKAAINNHVHVSWLQLKFSDSLFFVPSTSMKFNN